MGAFLANILKYLKIAVKIAPYVYQGIQWGKKIVKELRKKEPVKTINTGLSNAKRKVTRYVRPSKKEAK